ncbi:MAG: hypothetical protein OEV77_01010 [Nitrospira sp.]|nr:hypothetical protein [Nitrospira sp.]
MSTTSQRIMSNTKAGLHRLTPFAIQDNRTLHYPDPDAAPRLL